MSQINVRAFAAAEDREARVAELEETVAQQWERIQELEARLSLGEAGPASLGASRLRALVGVLSGVLAETTVDGLLQQIAHAARTLTSARLAVCGHGQRDGGFRLGAMSRSDGAPTCGPGLRFTITRGGVYRQVIEQGRPLRLDAEALVQHPDWWGLPEGHPPLRGLLAVPLGADQRWPAGLIMVSDSAAGRFGPEDQDTLSQLALFASLAMQHIEARSELKEMNHEKDEFLGMLSHELRNPLAPIRAAVHIMERVEPGCDAARRAMQTISRQADQLARLIEDLVDATRLSRGKVHLRCVPLELGGLLRRTLVDYRQLLCARGLHVSMQLPDEPLRVMADPARIAQVLGNLVENAAKFTPVGGQVRLAMESDPVNRRALVRVQDSGVGIEPELLAKIFRTFTQASRGLDRPGGGLGLGLALARSLLELHGGSIAAFSAGAGKGSEFVIGLPLLDESAADEEASDRQLEGARRQILVIDDNEDAGETLRVVLELWGHSVQVASSGREGIERARTSPPEVLLCDIGLPGLDGYQVARAFREDPRLSGVFLVALSGYSGPEDRRRSAEAGFQVHLAKPPAMEQLQELLLRLDRDPAGTVD